MNSKPRVAVVTGANRGIGFEVCCQLAGRGIHVVLTSRDDREGDGRLPEIERARSGCPLPLRCSIIRVVTQNPGSRLTSRSASRDAGERQRLGVEGLKL